MSTRRTGGRPVEVVPSITSAQQPLAEDQARRTRRYLVQMGIRLVCFVAAIAVWSTLPWLTFVLAAAAVVLPYVAVLGANAGRDQVHYDTSPMEHRALPPGTTPDGHGIGPGERPGGNG
ncbi:DUF3099 domain-containing protein [Cellulosimicrobium marinum]|uniref:DUF3099 domain-containing protein n=1 Tax=Cellulosimicrobium marinum TaxID=1638992 RepID=UPI001E49D5D9|nr:DUF3099 domain-containing protein [Cellulosimicrobium marinum]MCB7137285.1 DUF3099 domain-containing protein [Cellulosimicrobium marinum]